jgi:cardiolipin synthase (CMP-forming)
MTLPNVITLLRILLTPLLVWLLLDHRMKQALLVFLIAGFSDGLDGLIARVFHQKSKLGAYLDPLADKLLLVSSFILLGHMEKIPYWLVIITVSRDAIIVLGIVTLMLHQLRVEIKPLVLSKLNTLLQLLTIFVVLGSVYFTPPPWGLMLLFSTTAMLSIASGLHYILRGIRLWEAQRGNNDANAGA